jgi:hypothetical protein
MNEAAVTARNDFNELLETISSALVQTAHGQSKKRIETFAGCA